MLFQSIVIVILVRLLLLLLLLLMGERLVGIRRMRLGWLRIRSGGGVGSVSGEGIVPSAGVGMRALIVMRARRIVL